MTHYEVENVACAICGCVCDDLTVEVSDGKVSGAQRACYLAEPWFLEQSSDSPAPARIDGRPATLEDAAARAASILSASLSPLIYGLSRSSTAGQRAAVHLADRLGATIDTTASTCHAPSIMALQASGESTSSLGEVKNRSDLVVYWGSNPVESHPRHIERCVDAPGMFVPEGRSGRHLVVIDVTRTATAELADTFIQVDPGGDFELISALRMAIAGRPLEIESAGGVGRQEIRTLANLLKTKNYGAVFFGLGLTRHGVPHANVEALLRLVTDVNSHVRCVVRRMRVPGDVAGADSVLCWQTGFPFSVNFARGYPRYNPGEFTGGAMLERGEVDAVLLVGAEGVDKLSPSARRRLAELPTIILDYPTASRPFTPAVDFTTAIYGVHRSGTAYRMDEVPIPLRSFLPSDLPSDDEVLKLIHERLMDHD